MAFRIGAKHASILISEREHASDFLAALNDFQRAGENVEKQERASTFGGKEECEAHSTSSMVHALGPILQRVCNETRLSIRLLMNPAPEKRRGSRRAR